MNAAGATIQETLAMLTGISEITQKPGEAGDFIKISSMRIRGLAKWCIGNLSSPFIMKMIMHVSQYKLHVITTI